MTKTLLGKKTFSVAMTIVLGLTLAIGLSGCGKSDQEAIKEVITQEFDSAKNLSGDFLKAASLSADSAVEQMGIDPNEMMKSWFSGFDYKIGDITVNGDTAKVKTTITCKQLGDALDIDELSASVEQYYNDNPSSTESDLYKYMGKIFMEKLGSISTKTSEVTINAVKVGDKWTMSSTDQNDLLKALVGSYYN